MKLLSITVLEAWSHIALAQMWLADSIRENMEARS